MSDLLFLMTPIPVALVQAAFTAQATAGVPLGSWWLWLVFLGLCSWVVAWLLQRENVLPAENSVETASSSPSHAGADSTVEGEPPAALASQAHSQHNQTPSTAIMANAPPTRTEPVEATEITRSNSAELADDLTAIEGIGPKIKGILQEADVLTFSDLARADVGDLKQILLNAGLRVNNPATWPAQAALAAAGKWDDLKAMQVQLKAGRRN